MRLFSRYQSTGVLISSTDTEVTAHTPTDVEIDEFSNMWRTLIDDSLCNSNSLGKALSASLFSMIAPLARHNQKVVTAILSPNFVKLMTQTISSNKSSPIFGAFSTAISVCENEFKVTKDIALSALYALSSFGDLNFDRVTRTRTIETLCNTLDVESTSEFLKFLLRSVSTPLAGGTEDAEIKADEDADIDSSDDKSSAKLSKTDATRLKAADALVSFFKTSEDTQLSTSRSALLLPTLQILSLHSFASLTVTPLQAVNDFALQADLSNFSDCLVAKPEIGATGRRELRSRVTALIKYATFSSPTSISFKS
jgi:flagellar biosynthesis regulator FlaF